MAVFYVEELTEDKERTGVVFKVDDVDLTALRIAVFDDLEACDGFLKSWNGTANLDPQ